MNIGMSFRFFERFIQNFFQKYYEYYNSEK